MNQCPRLVCIFSITTVVVFTFSYTPSPDLMSNEDEIELIQTLEDASKGLGRRLQEDNSQKSQDPPREDSVQAMGLKLGQKKEPLSVEYVKATKDIDKVKAEYKECERQLKNSQRRAEKLAETLKATQVILQTLKEEGDYADIDEDEEDEEEYGIKEEVDH